jgi:uncharacterized protein
MKTEIIDIISRLTAVSDRQVRACVKLLDEGCSIPFISRYRKEMTGSLDEVEVGMIKSTYEKVLELVKRKESILASIEEQGELTDELKQRIEQCWESRELEDLYLPYRPKRKTRASLAVERGLEPLAKIIMAQKENNINAVAERYVGGEVEDVDAALQGARDIIAEWINERPNIRYKMRQLFVKTAHLQCLVKKNMEKEGEKYADYFEYNAPMLKIPSHRVLAIFRGEKEGYLKVKIEPDEEKAVRLMETHIIKFDSPTKEEIGKALKDCYKRLLQPAMETEFRKEIKQNADEEAIRVFAKNLRQLLLEAPLGQKRVLAIDPGFRTGCKVVCLDEQGQLEHNQTIYPFGEKGNKVMAAKQLKTMVNSFKIDAIAIGNGTAGRETEDLVKGIRFDKDVKAFVVSEDGASVYSASEVAREEFEKYDLTVRGAVSIGRRLMDPLAELVKIDPKSIGVGQYQHDVDQHMLKESLDRVTESCVNQVGVDLNTASKQLLTYVSGLGPQLAQNILDYRNEQGAFTSREELKHVKRMGAKAFEQSAAFLRIAEAKNPLDNSAVHPESYAIVEKMASDLNTSVADLMFSEDLQEKIQLERYVSEQVGMPTLNDIRKELAKPGRDPRKAIQHFEFDKKVRKPEDLVEGMILPGIVTNITNFGAFVDVGVKQDGLVHISELADRFVSDPNEIVQLHQQLRVRVLTVDLQRKRLAFSMKNVD